MKNVFKKFLICLVIVIQISSLCSLGSPEGAQIIYGNASINQVSPASLSISQLTDKVIIDWQKFNISPQEIVQFLQPSAFSIALNRVTGGDPSSILGTLTSNGKLFLINPNGILFGASSVINVGGLLASTLDISNNDFISGNLTLGDISASSTSGSGGTVNISTSGVLSVGNITTFGGSGGTVSLISTWNLILDNSSNINTNSLTLAGAFGIGLSGDPIQTTNVTSISTSTTGNGCSTYVANGGFFNSISSATNNGTVNIGSTSLLAGSVEENLPFVCMHKKMKGGFCPMSEAKGSKKIQVNKFNVLFTSKKITAYGGFSFHDKLPRRQKTLWDRYRPRADDENRIKELVKVNHTDIVCPF